MKTFFVLGVLSVLAACSDYSKVEKSYQQKNPHAKDLLLHGFTAKASEYISSELIKKALKGDEEAKQIIYAQMESMRGMPVKHHQSVAIIYSTKADSNR